MNLYKCSKAEVHRVLSKILRNAQAKIQRRKNKEIEEGKTGSSSNNEKNLTDISNLCNLC